MDLKAEEGVLLPSDIVNHGELKKNVLMFLNEKYKDLKQMARVNWSIDGDENSHFFHSLFKAHALVNLIHGMVNSDISSPDPTKN